MGDTPKDYRPHKTLYNRFICWSRLGVLDRILAALAAERDPAMDGSGQY
ncbi:hypothetical protein MUO32_17530 [Shinella sp. CPCC 101442]|nr:hypothetical protein [Shinella sp. CPCC 101442]MCR6500850.1 hypothetical protein [Shinella sp. CPCC 101442]